MGFACLVWMGFWHGIFFVLFGILTWDFLAVVVNLTRDLLRDQTLLLNFVHYSSYMYIIHVQLYMVHCTYT